MVNHAVTLKVSPFLRIECKFWLTDDGWSGSCEQLPITVQAGSFEHAKSEISNLALSAAGNRVCHAPRECTSSTSHFVIAPVVAVKNQNLYAQPSRGQ